MTGVLALGGAVASPAESSAASRSRVGCSFPIESIGNRAPTASSGPFLPAVTASFAVLRRASLPEDVPPPINPLGEDLGYRLGSYFPDEIRQLNRDAEGDRYFLVPGFERGFSVPPARCLPKDLRKRRAKLVAEQRKQEVEPVYCIEDVGPRRPRYAGATCQPFSAIQTGETLAATAASRTDVVELAPDGVATVRLSYRGGEAINAAVTSNSYSFTPPQRPIKAALLAVRKLVAKARHVSQRQRIAQERSFLKRVERIAASLIPQTVQWLDAAGTTIRSFAPSAHMPAFALIGPLITVEGESSGAERSVALSTG